MADKPMFIEWFCGIGGFAESVRGLVDIKIAIDINQNALAIHRANFDCQTLCKSIESLQGPEIEGMAESSWWMSPPCQPHTSRGNKKDLADPRSRAFENMLRLIEAYRPPEIAMENVPGFAQSESCERLKEVLASHNYHVSERIICPSDFGRLNRRRRFYLIASTESLPVWREYPNEGESHFIDLQNVDRELAVTEAVVEKYLSAINVFEPGFSERTACFTSAYGRSVVRSGSYLKTQNGFRRFSPREILSQLGYGDSFYLPDWPPSKLWPLVGNSLSIPVVRYVASHLPSVAQQMMALPEP